MRIFSTVVGILLILMGLIWIGQGTGYFPYPASSFMIAQPIWAFWGLVAALVGIGVIYLGRRLGLRR